MSKKYTISHRILSEIANYFDDAIHLEKSGRQIDSCSIKNEENEWLKDPAIIEEIRYRRGTWNVKLIFANVKNHSRLVVCRVTKCTGSQPASTATFYQRRGVTENNGESSNASISDWKLCDN